MFGAVPQDSSCSTHGYSHAEYGVSSSVPYVPRPADRVCEGDIGFGGSHNKKPEVAREVPAPTQKRKKVKASEWEQTEPAEGGPIDPELILSYGGHDHGSLKFQSHYMALTGWELTDAHVRPLASGSGLMHLLSYMFQHPNAALLSAFVER
ncbi:hypothetical protein M9H77_34788 [Catharanthus roseus]|uniref:Uncharacterized protein n=1 Tax=Catharanthus roseus TaxID=4058 RepID=A0ACB9ZMG0_CATRO|nr:hypothetical protein M9H77_34788 [Catharanthus roseus]